MRRPEAAQPAELEQQPLVMVLLDDSGLKKALGLGFRVWGLGLGV